MKSFLFLFTGFFLGTWFAWPGIVIPKNWKCFKNIASRSIEDKISFKAALAVSPNYLLKGKRNMATKIRIVSDACFR